MTSGRGHRCALAVGTRSGRWVGGQGAYPGCTWVGTGVVTWTIDKTVGIGLIRVSLAGYPWAGSPWVGTPRPALRKVSHRMATRSRPGVQVVRVENGERGGPA